MTLGPAIDKHGNLYIDDAYRIRKIDMTTGIINTIAGNGSGMYIGDGMNALSAQFDSYGLCIDAIGNVYISGMSHNRIFKIDTFGTFHCVAGNGNPGYSGDGGLATNAQIHWPEGVATDHCGNLYIADMLNQRIRKVTFNTSCASHSICGTLDINAAITPLTFTLSPNPTTSHTTITSSTTLKKLQLTNTLGAIILQQEIKANKTTLDLANQPSGIYFLTVYDEHGIRKTGKIIKQ